MKILGIEKRLLVAVIAPMHPKCVWKARKAKKDEIGFPHGLALAGDFLADEERLGTAVEDFAEFQGSVGLNGSTPGSCFFIRDPSLVPEEHKVSVLAGRVEVRAADSEGIRRALIWIEDEMLQRGGAFLPKGNHRRFPLIRTRLSRCFFGPINRPPGNRDELADEVNYYPEPYLNRLAHDGINGLWVSLRFQDSVPSRLFPEFAPRAEKRLAKLRATVKRCARYGIKVYGFCIEPESHPVDAAIFQRHPELKGHVIDFRAAFCTSTKIGQAYLKEATRTLFERVPGLGGLIVIPVGERFTQCASISYAEDEPVAKSCSCPRCSRKTPSEVLRQTLAAFRSGMKRAAPESELIAWPYGQMMMWGEGMTAEAARHIPLDVILQHNFETGGTSWQLGRPRPLWDYWLSVVGPSPVFAKCARIASQRGMRMSAKLQVGCSHEDATVPCVPVPGILHAKYQKLHQLKVSSVMQSWYFGNTPSLMTRSAGRLSFAPFPKQENEFLRELAQRDWQTQAPKVVRAWRLFQRGYENYPSNHLFGYYGPVQDGACWPLHLIPRNRALTPTWKRDHPVSGDYLADCLSSFFTLREVLSLCRKMTMFWDRGLILLRAAFTASAKTAAQHSELRVAEAIGLQFASTVAILEFYQFREALAEATGSAAVAILDRMTKLVEGEIRLRRQMIVLCREEATLGFHSEAEGYKVTPAKIGRGIRALERLLTKEFPEVRAAARRGEQLFGHYTGRNPQCMNVTIARRTPNKSWPLRNLLTQNSPLGGRTVPGTLWTRSRFADGPWLVSFRPGREPGALRFEVEIRNRQGEDIGDLLASWNVSVVVDIEPARLHPRIQFSADIQGHQTSLIDEGYLIKTVLPFGAEWKSAPSGGEMVMAVPLRSARLSPLTKRFRFNLRVLFFNAQTDEHLEYSWTRRKPRLPRQAWDDANPATDYGWVELAPPIKIRGKGNSLESRSNPSR